MKTINSIIRSAPKAVEQFPQLPVPEIDEARFIALQNLIIQAHLACAQPMPEAEFVNALIIAWNRALRLVPTPYLEPALQFAIENHTGAGKITCPAIIRAYRDLLLRHKNSQFIELPGPRTEPPQEYYELLAKLKIFPKPASAPKALPPPKARPQYKIIKQAGHCTDCSLAVDVFVSYQDRKLCLDCALKAGIVSNA